MSTSGSPRPTTSTTRDTSRTGMVVVGVLVVTLIAVPASLGCCAASRTTAGRTRGGECGDAPSRVSAEDDAARADPEPGELDPEDVRVLHVVGVQEEVPGQRGDRAQGSDHEPAAPDHDLGPGADGEPCRVGWVGREAV